MRKQIDVKRLHHEINRAVGLILSGVSKFTLPTPDPELGRKLCIGAARELETLATELVNKDLKKASQYWIDANKAKMTIEKVTAIAGGPQVKWTMVPEHTLKFVEFMHSVGTIKVKTADWKDLFFPEIHDLPGS